MNTLFLLQTAMFRLPLLAVLCLLLSLPARADAQNRFTLGPGVTRPVPPSLYTWQTTSVPRVRPIYSRYHNLRVPRPARPYKPTVAGVRIKTCSRFSPSYSARPSRLPRQSLPNIRLYHQDNRINYR